MINVPIPVLTIVSTSISVSTNEGVAARIVIEADENPKQPVIFSYTPTETGTSYLAPETIEGVTYNSGDSRPVELEFTQATPGSDDPWLVTLSVATQKSEIAGGTITVVLDQPGANDKYTVGSSDTSTITVI